MKRKVLYVLLVLAVLLAGLLLGRSYLLEKTPIPVLSFCGDISEMESKSDVRNISVTYKDAFRTVEGFAKIKIQGTSSLGYRKKNYTINLYKDASLEEEWALNVGWGAQSKYCLKANWIDLTHARNVVTAKLASEIQAEYNVLEQAPRNGLIDGFPVEIYINGEFLGLYTFNIPKDAWQFGMDEENPDHIVICGEGWEPANLFRGEPDFSTWAVEAGEESAETLDKMNALFDFVMNTSDDEFKADFEKHIDLDAALNYYIIADFAYLPDNLGKNMLIATYDGATWYPSLYDLDTSWGTHYSGRELWDYENAPTPLSNNLLFERLETCFPGELAERYFALRDGGILTKQHVMDLFNNFNAMIPEETFEKEENRWGPGIPGFYYDQIEAFLDYTTVYSDQKYSKMLEGA